jgi:SAM-dependent methyltransferase
LASNVGASGGSRGGCDLQPNARSIGWREDCVVQIEARLTFDGVAELYDRARPGYPAELFEDLLELAGVSAGDRVLEVGCGTGQASVELGRRGLALLCLDPGPSMVSIARRNLAFCPNTEVKLTTLEGWPVEEGMFDLVVSAQAFHWVAPDVGFSRSASALRPGGALALLGNTVPLDRHPLRSEIDAIYARWAPSLGNGGGSSWYCPDGPIPGLFVSSGSFCAPLHRCYPWFQEYTATQYRELLATFSPHRLLPEPQRESLHDALCELIEARGSTLEIPYESQLYIGRLKDRTAPLRGSR